MKEDFDHRYTRNLVCPHCGYEDRDSWEILPEEEDLGVITCGSCEKEFLGERIKNCSYCSEIIPVSKGC